MTRFTPSRRDRGSVFTYDGDAIKIMKTTWASSLRRAGLRHFRFHDLRHTANTRMMLAGVLQEVRREILGHTSQRSRDVNDRYTQIELPEKREAIRKLEVWLASQARLARRGRDDAAAPTSPKRQPNRQRKQPDDRTTQTRMNSTRRSASAFSNAGQGDQPEAPCAGSRPSQTISTPDRHLAALGGIDGIEREIGTMRSFLLLLP